MDPVDITVPSVTVDEVVHLAELACDREDWDRALQWLDVALAGAPTSARLWQERGYALGELGRVDEAVVSFSQSIRFGNTGEASLLSALVLVRAGRRKEAAVDIEHALALSPDLTIEIAGDLELEPLIEHECSRAFHAAIHDLRA